MRLKLGWKVPALRLTSLVQKERQRCTCTQSTLLDFWLCKQTYNGNGKHLRTHVGHTIQLSKHVSFNCTLSDDAVQALRRVVASYLESSASHSIPASKCLLDNREGQALQSGSEGCARCQPPGPP